MERWYQKRYKKARKEFKHKNSLEKLKGMSRIGGKVLKPVGIVLDITDNLSKKTWEEKVAGMSVDLASDGACTVAGAILGSAIPVPVVGTLLGAAAGAAVGSFLDKTDQKGKSRKDYAKENLSRILKNNFSG
ncbi:glycine zipper domain-containing protein [Staphylococcus sp. EZ-P03]|uniref:glycine zipper domain-containing protein n=1 Tax=Staphylococcus sp. EZ-P03 TaxID=2282739 RepID=UPI000DF7E04D|nr:glycine zipper domain-containing protein [Staphylococcus sp. EZ-P03]